MSAMMKKMIVLLLLVCLLPLWAAAETEEAERVIVTLQGAEISFAPASSGYTLTRESSASVFNRAGLSQREVIPWMESGSIYALAIDEAWTYQIAVVITETAEQDFDLTTAAEAEQWCAETAEYLAYCGYDVKDAAVYEAEGGHKFVRSILCETNAAGAEQCSVEYLTCQAGYNVQIWLMPYEGAPTLAQLTLCAEIVDSLSVQPKQGETELALEGISIRMFIPEELKLLTAQSEEADWGSLPQGIVSVRKKDFAKGWLQGLIVSPNGTWEIFWTVFKGADDGDLDEISAENALNFGQGLADSYAQDGHTVGSCDAGWQGAHQYVHIVHSYPSVPSGRRIYAEEYYTRQDGWNVLVTVSSEGSPLTQEAKDLLKEIVSSQRIVVAE